MKTYFSRLYFSVSVFLALFFAVSFANAVGPDFTTLTSGLDFSTVITAILTIYAAMAGVGIVIKGGGAILKRLGFS